MIIPGLNINVNWCEQAFDLTLFVFFLFQLRGQTGSTVFYTLYQDFAKLNMGRLFPSLQRLTVFRAQVKPSHAGIFQGVGRTTGNH